MTTTFDIETSALPDAQLAQAMPVFVANKTLKDPAKIAVDLAEKEAAWRERAALSPMTGQILAIGLLDDAVHILSGPEPAMLEAFWQAWDLGGRMVGFNVKDFDLRFAVVRSRILGVPVPGDLFQGRYWNMRVVDLLEIWCCYSRDYAGNGLDAVCKACGLGAKSASGADFGRLWVEDRKAALDYLAKDLELEAALAKRLGIL